MKRSLLFMACLAAACLGFAYGTVLGEERALETVSEPLEVGKNAATIEDITDYKTVQEYGVEAQGTYLSYNDYEREVAEVCNR